MLAHVAHRCYHRKNDLFKNGYDIQFMKCLSIVDSFSQNTNKISNVGLNSHLSEIHTLHWSLIMTYSLEKDLNDDSTFHFGQCF